MKERRSGWRTVFLSVGLLWAVTMTGCAGKTQTKEFQAQYLDCFDTITTVTVCTDSEEHFHELEEQIHEELLRYHRLFDIYQSYEDMNNIKTINDNAGIKPVKVDREILDLLELSVDMYGVTDGKVNVAMGSVLSLWHDYRTAGLQKPELAQLPDRAQLENAAKYTDIRLIEIDKNASTVYLPDSSMKLDVGATAKGYAVQKLCDFMKGKGIKSALISAGGNVQTIGTRADKKPWRIGIQNPDTTSSQGYLHALRLEDMALVTSGTYQRFYTVDGVRYHHIIDPDTLMPRNDYASVTILSRDSGMADALSTAVFNMSLEQGQELIEALGDTEALWVMPDGTEVMSAGFGAYLDD